MFYTSILHLMFKQRKFIKTKLTLTKCCINENVSNTNMVVLKKNKKKKTTKII